VCLVVDEREAFMVLCDLTAWTHMGGLIVMMCRCMLLACCGVIVLTLTVLRFVVVFFVGVAECIKCRK
jgi:hypothetical protein